jgi:steroid 5-alpha reductase family enzyme
MSFWNIYLNASFVVLTLITIFWIISVVIKNASIVDSLWGLGFMAMSWYALTQVELYTRNVLLVVLVTIWALRLSGYITWRNWGKGEDFRYQNFRQKYGPDRYWWFSFFQVFLLQGILILLIAAPLMATLYLTKSNQLNIIDYIAVVIWLIGFIFESGGDFQMARFKADTANKGKVMNQGFWKLTRHPNYFGDATQWWAYGLFSVAVGCYLPLLSSLIMTLLLLKVSGVALLEKTLTTTKPKYHEYIKRTSAFVPWFPKK